MRTFTYPGPSLPAIPSFALDVPDGWRSVSAPALLGAFLAPEEHVGFTANVVVGIERAAEGVGLDVIAAGVLEGEQPPGFALEDERLLELPDGIAVLRRQGRDEPRIGQRLTQLLCLLMVPVGGGLQDLVTLTGTCLAARAEEDVPVLADVLASFRLTDPPS